MQLGLIDLKESRASFAIVHEAPQDHKVRHFAAATGEISVRPDDPMASEHLLDLPSTVLTPNALRVGIRNSPAFVGVVQYASCNGRQRTASKT